MIDTTPSGQELGLVPIRKIPVCGIWPSPENDQLYKPVDENDPEIKDLARSIAKVGVQEPLILSSDHSIISGHRRFVAANLAGLHLLPCRVLDFDKDDDPDRFMQLLRECNRQRVKTFAEAAREAAMDVDPEIAYQSLIEHRQESAAVTTGDNIIVLRGQKNRSKISQAKMPFLEAAQVVISDLENFWPLSVRQIHYRLLNDPPLKHASKPDSVYCNDKTSYKALSDLLTRARIEGIIQWEVITDETRPVTVWEVQNNVDNYIKNELHNFGRGYWRDLMQSQPNHIEIIGEKNTIQGAIRPVAMKYCIPMTIGRGYCSPRPKYDMAERFAKSGKQNLILLILSDFDPDGEEIAHSFARSMRDEFDIKNIIPIKVALHASQVQSMQLPPGGKAKKSSTNYKRFAEQYGDDVWELEALPPDELQEILRAEIDKVIDIEAFNHELDQEEIDAGKMEGARRIVIEALRHYEPEED